MLSFHLHSTNNSTLQYDKFRTKYIKIILSMLVAGICFGDDSVAAHKHEMNQMREENGKGSMNQERDQKRIKEKNVYKGSNGSSNSVSGKKDKGSKSSNGNGSSGGGKR